MNAQTNHRLSFWAILALVAVLALAIASPSFADSVTGSASVLAGTLNLEATDDPTFAATTLDGTDQTQTDSIAISVEDFTGSGAGWNLQITSTLFDSGSHTLADTALTILGVSALCNVGQCTNPTNSVGDVYPFSVPAAAVAPGPGKFFNAAVDTGLGSFTVTPQFQIAIPADTYIGDYVSTVTITLAAAP
jgi:hypothetical protein